MKIDNTYTHIAPATSSVKPAKANSGSNKAEANTEVTLSNSAKLAAAESESPMDIGRIEEIKQAIADGRFKINASAIADRLISSARDLVDAQNKP